MKRQGEFHAFREYDQELVDVVCAKDGMPTREAEYGLFFLLGHGDRS